MIIQLLPLLAVGAVGGFLSGLLGVGGGVIFVPALYFFLSDMHSAVGTSLALVFITAASSTFWHRKKGAVDFALVRRWAPFLVAGVVAGSSLATSVDADILKKIFSAMMVAVAAHMVFGREPDDNAQPHKMSIWAERGAVGGIGFLSALIGMGGAILTIPFMSYIGVPMRRAVGTGGALGCVIALPAATTYAVHGYLSLLALAAIVPAAMLASPLGVQVSHRLPRHLLRRIFAVILVIVATRMFLS